MRGYKCDMCGEMFASELPATEGWHEWTFNKTPIYSITLSHVVVVLKETMSFKGQDLCKDCLIRCLEHFISVYKSKQELK